MVRFVTYPHPPMETTEMEEWERRYREVVGWIVAFGGMSALERRRPTGVAEGGREENDSKNDQHEDFLDDAHDVGLEPLREWVQEQRRLYYHGMLPEYRVNLLNQIRFQWLDDHSRNQGGDDLIHGNQEQRALLDCPSVVTVPPETSVQDELIETSTWDTTESAVGAANNSASENATFAAAAVAAPCSAATVQDAVWEERYRALCEYKNQHGNCRVPRRYKEDRSLGLWVGNQRMALKKGTIRPDRKRLLEAIGFEAVDSRYSWSVERNTDRLERAWLDMYKALLRFHATSGNTDVPKNYVCTIAGRQIALGRWVSRQRTYFAKGIIREDRRQMLDDIGFVWCSPATIVLKGQDLEPLDFRKAAPAASGIDDADEDSYGSGPTAAHPPAFVVVSPNPPRHAPVIRTDPRTCVPPVVAIGGVTHSTTTGHVATSLAQPGPADRSRRSLAARLSSETRQAMISPKRAYPYECLDGESHRRTIPFSI